MRSKAGLQRGQFGQQSKQTCGKSILLPARTFRISDFKSIFSAEFRGSNRHCFRFHLLLRFSPIPTFQMASFMKRMLPYKIGQFVLLGCALFALMIAPGCMKEMAQLFYVIKGHETPPVFQDLKEKKVAIVCLSDVSAYGPDTLSYTITKRVSAKLMTSKEKIDVVSPVEVEEFVDLNGWDESSVSTLGSAVNADFVLVIDISDYSIRDGQTLFKGRSDITLKVFDVNDSGRLAFQSGPNEFVFPENGRPVMQSSERQFEQFYLARLTDYIAKIFTTHDHMESFAANAMDVN